MKARTLLCGLALCTLGAVAQTEVSPYVPGATVEGVTYYLPRTTYHTSRHTFASTVTLANNISLEVVSKMLGHTNTRMTAHYAKLVDESIAKQMDQIVDLFD